MLEHLGSSPSGGMASSKRDTIIPIMNNEFNSRFPFRDLLFLFCKDEETNSIYDIFDFRA